MAGSEPGTHLGMTSPGREDPFERLERIVRFGLEPDQPQLIEAYLQLAETRCANLSTQSTWRFHRDIFRLMLEVICDPCVPRHWRFVCLDHAYRPIARLWSQANTRAEERELHRLSHELGTLSHYFLG
ncbi:MAG: hypothetical protein AAGE01_26040 [Pseudomonadota bacterium]